MKLDRNDIKRRVRLLMFTTQPSPIVVALLFVSVTWLVSLITGRLLGTIYSVNTELFMQTGDPFAASAFYPEKITPVFLLLMLAIQLVNMTLSAGYSIYALRISRRVKGGFGELFDCFGLFLQIIGVKLTRFVRVYIWYLPLVLCWVLAGWIALDEPSFLAFLGMTAEEINAIPHLDVIVSAILIGSSLLSLLSIFAMYKYRMSLYLMLDHPEKSCIACLRESRELLRGHKRQLFRLDLSLIVPYILSAFMPARPFTLPMTELCCCEFYNELTGQAVSERPPVDLTEQGPWDA